MLWLVTRVLSPVDIYEQNLMTDSAFIGFLTELVYEGSIQRPSHSDTLERVQTLIEEHGLLLAALKDVSEAYVAASGWVEETSELSTALLWGLQVLQDCKAWQFPK